jgi:hypothetical protein
VSYTQASTVAQLLSQVYGQTRSGGLRVGVDDVTNSLILMGTGAQVAEVRKLLQQLEELSKDAARQRPRQPK